MENPVFSVEDRPDNATAMSVDGGSADVPGSNIMPTLPGLTRLRWNSDAEQVDVQYKQMDNPSKYSILQGLKGWVIFLLAFAITFVIGLVIGYMIRRAVQSQCDIPSSVPLDPAHSKSYPDYCDKDRQGILEYIQSSSIRENLRSYTRFVHLAGQKNNDLLADEIQLSWTNAGLDTTRSQSYRVLLSYPNTDADKKNFLGLLDSNQTVRYRCTSGDVTDPATIPYSAWSANGTVQGDLVYANYGRVRDFEALAAGGVNVTDKIVIMRYGWGFRGDKIKEAQQRGVSGAILFPDPVDFSRNPEEIWPNGWWIDGDTVVVGTVRFGGSGDPLTPDGPSLDGAYRIPMNETDLPTIPVIPISFNEAKELMKNLAGDVIAPDFEGGLDIPYNSGPGFVGERANWTVKLQSFNQRYQVAIKNIIGYIRGHEEPDRYVMLFNHRDAWNHGANDPSGGTAVLTEVARAFGQYHKNTGWQPRRTIIFANWDAEEQGLVGSFEWVEEHEQEINDRVVAVVNIDSPMKGNYSFRASASPLLTDVILQATNHTIDAMSADNETVYETWSEKFGKKPVVTNIGAGSDHVGFIHMLGIPSAYPAYTYDTKRYPNMSSTPFYHTKLDIFEMVEKYIDPSFLAHETLARVVVDVILRLSDSAKLPLSVNFYTNTLKNAYNVTEHKYGSQLAEHGISLDLLQSAITNFTRGAEDFNVHMDKVDPEKPILLREANDRVMQLSRAFINPRGLPNRPQIRNMLLAPSAQNWYRGSVFPGVTDAILSAQTDADWIVVRQQLSLLIVAIQSATHILTGGVVGINIL